VDSAFSLEPAELASLVSETERAWQSLGQVRYGPTEAEKKNLVLRRFIYAAADIANGETFTMKNIRIVRPGHGAPPAHYTTLLGRSARRNYRHGEALSLEQLLYNRI
jgi:sialic acid synthase SpsE